MKTIALIQARLGSSRLPLKNMIHFRGQPMVDWIIQRVRKAKLIDEIVFAIPDTSLDTILRDYLQKQGLSVFCGSENDVLSRFYLAAKKHKADRIVRICADNPLIYWQAIDDLIEFYQEQQVDYAYNHIPRNNLWPDGLGAEILSFELLEKIANLAKEPHQREHCLTYIWENKEQFKIATFNPKDSALHYPNLKLDIDTIEDYHKLALLPLHPNMSAKEIITACTAKKEE